VLHVTLATMPWQSLDCPSISLGILSSIASQIDAVETDELYANLQWAEFLLDRTDGRITPLIYTEIADSGLFFGMGDWIFTPPLYSVQSWKVAQYTQYLQERGVDPSLTVELHLLSNQFVDLTADRLVDRQIDVLALTSTFMQNVASLALARAVKRRDSSVRVVMGGGNCDGVQGIALHRNFDCIDYVVRGEGEIAWAGLLEALRDGEGVETIGSLCWRSAQGTRTNEPGPEVSIADVPRPSYDSYFAALATSAVESYVEPKLVLESARGCWWGQTNHCTFCGLNGSSMTFRSKPSEAVVAEIVDSCERHRVLDVIMVDNILAKSYISELMPELQQQDIDLRIHYEIKSNVSVDDLVAMSSGGVTHIQPGIESLSTDVLRMMDKGVTGVHNVRLLRNAQDVGLTVSWNILFGFPDETAVHYEAIIGQIPLLYHLQPPASAARLSLQRFSPYFDNPNLGFLSRRPAAFYEFLYDLPPAEMRDLVYVFDSAPKGLTDDEAEPLINAVVAWRAKYKTSTLTYLVDESGVLIADRREDRACSDYLLKGADAEIFTRLLGAGTLATISARGSRSLVTLGSEQIERSIFRLVELGLVFGDGNAYVALPTAAGSSVVKYDEAS